ncbi:MAG: hypothetical protein K5870_01315 [Lachnospiraceae bacterium]|nr:hypothetical protein [Lachnospiraceae bacterium]
MAYGNYFSVESGKNMKLSIQHANYEGCEKATKMSISAGSMRWLGLSLGAILGALTMSFVVFLLTSVVDIALSIYMDRKAFDIYQIDLYEKQIGRTLNKSEKSEVLKNIKAKRKADATKD